MKCPHCGHEFVPEFPGSDFRRRLEQLADGTRTTREIADIVGRSIDSVRNTLNKMEKNGASISFPPNPTIDRNEQIFADRQTGMRLREIGIRHGITAGRVRQIIAKEERRKRRKERDQSQTA